MSIILSFFPVIWVKTILNKRCSKHNYRDKYRYVLKNASKCEIVIFNEE